MARHGSAADWASPMPPLSASGATCPPICLGAVRLTLTDDGRYLSPLCQPFDEISGVAKFVGQAAVRIRPVHFSRLLSVDLISSIHLISSIPLFTAQRTARLFPLTSKTTIYTWRLSSFFFSSLVRTDTPADNRPGAYRSSGQAKVGTRMSVLHTLGCLSSKSSGLVHAPARLHRSWHTDATVIRPSFFPDCLVGWLALSPI
ncbi:hypothetical protein IWX49DRAFT_292431 [Phyllosticta citricarpa]|uniref:Uncharacterized protein n=2 Tax=Phyllosticta TaxID=121621 RepID=A0ABR1MJQ2_9PEZI